MLERIAAHYVGIRTGSERKYRILAELQRKGNAIEFDVLYYAQKIKREDIEEEIGSKEGKLIRQHRPILNTQIPSESDWRKWNTNTIDVDTALSLLLGD